MAWEPPYDLDPHLAVRDPSQLPLLLRRGIHDVVEKEKTGTLHEKIMKGFNCVAKMLTDSGRLRRGTLELTPLGIKREKEVARLKDTRTKLYWLDRWAERLRIEKPGYYDKTWKQARSGS